MVNTEKSPDLKALFSSYLNRNIQAWHESGQTDAQPAVDQVRPFQDGQLLWIEPGLVYQYALNASNFLLGDREIAEFDKFRAAPANWENLVIGKASVNAVPFCLGNYPQMLRTVTPLLTNARLAGLRPISNSKGTQPSEGLNKIPQESQSPASALHRAAMHRLDEDFSAADKLLESLKSSAPLQWKGMVLNEQAALLWMKGEWDEAAQIWAAHPLPDSPVVLFNRGLVDLFADQPGKAASFFRRAVDGLRKNESPFPV